MHLGYDKGDPAGRGSGNSYNGFTPTTLRTELGKVEEPGVSDVCIVVCDGSKGCVRIDDAMAREMRRIYTAVNEAVAKERFVEFCEHLGERYPTVRQLWENSWNEFVPVLD